jgi:hypothetical protein
VSAQTIAATETVLGATSRVAKVVATAPRELMDDHRVVKAVGKPAVVTVVAIVVNGLSAAMARANAATPRPT